jgi:hypothetical protein
MEATVVTDEQRCPRERVSASRQATTVEDVASPSPVRYYGRQKALRMEGVGAQKPFQRSNWFGKMREITVQLARRGRGGFAPAVGRVSARPGLRLASRASDPIGPARICSPASGTARSLLPLPDAGQHFPTTGHGFLRPASNRRPAIRTQRDLEPAASSKPSHARRRNRFQPRPDHSQAAASASRLARPT